MTTGPLHTTRSIFCNLDAPKITILQILCSNLQMFPYRFQSVQALEPGDNQQRVDFANIFFIRYDEDSWWPLQILWMNEAHFTLMGT